MTPVVLDVLVDRDVPCVFEVELPFVPDWEKPVDVDCPRARLSLSDRLSFAE